ncbi:hypothetical protein [Chelativorans intermedius]|uniref:HEPN domain-containing protein n=1 Tax=Chelativorans intermedius TaxID=515947 RepID=A0ABV6D994_9HYPH|nr:hypothetical protein [Chelativorans intermedius]MCT8999992.1 hypothetical protein [Chelativorans intermedius]
MPVINPDHLLEQAERLTAPPEAGAPRQADLRRAISAAYYALFHEILIEATDNMIGRKHRQEARYELAYRSVDHKSLRLLCEEIRKQKLPAKYAKYEPEGGFGPDLSAVATAFLELQEKRNIADYDPLFRVRTSDAVFAVATSRDAIQRLRGTRRARRKAFLSLVFFSPRGQG